MEQPRGIERKLTTILYADGVGYSRLMAADEEATLRTLNACRAEIGRLIQAHQGRVFGTAGDSVAAEFPSAVEAVRCAIELQSALQGLDAVTPEGARMRFRIGVNLGDVMVEGGDLLGDGVNVAARLQGLADPSGICISGSVLDQVEGKLPVSCEPLGEQRLKNIARPVRAYAVRTVGHAPARRRGLALALPAGAGLALLLGLGALGARSGWLPLGTGAAPPTPGRAAIAVLPFANLSGDLGQDYFGDGLTEDVIAALGRFSALSVTAREAVQRYKGKDPGPGELARDLGVRYVLEGSVRRDGGRVRVTASLTDATSGRHLWSDRYDGELVDVFAVQDEITRNVAGALAVRLTRLEAERAAAKAPGNLAAYDLVLRGRAQAAANTEEANRAARDLFEQAVQLDPSYAPAYVGLGWTWVKAAGFGWTEFRTDALRRAEDLATRAISFDPDNAEAHALLGSAYINLGRYDLGLSEEARAIALNPSDAGSYASRGAGLVFTGYPEEAVAAFETALRLDPELGSGRLHPVGWAYYLVGRYEDAVRVLEAEALHSPEDYFVHAGLAASYAELGRSDDAAQAAAAVLRTWPFFEVEAFAAQFQGGEHRARITEGLRKAGLR